MAPKGIIFVAAIVAAKATNPTHYGNPKKGCESDEQSVRVQGLSGDFCSPPCSSAGVCPTDVPQKPKKVTATPTCMLQTPTGGKYCALKCTPSETSENGAANACGAGHCQSIQGVGICTYKVPTNESDVSMSTYVVPEYEEAYVTGGTLKLTWTDCGDASTHAKISSLKPDTLVLGQKTTIEGTGNLDEAVTGGSFQLEAKAGLIHQTYNGDACAPKAFQLPLGMGSLSWGGLKCPVASGVTTIDMDVTLSAKLPVSLARATIKLTASATTGDKLVCMSVTTAPASSEIVV